MAKTKGLPASAIAFREARRHVRLSQQELAAELLASTRSISRWEMGHMLPDLHARVRVIEWARALPPSVGEPVLSALGVVIAKAPEPTRAPVPQPPPPAPVVAVRAPPAIDARALVDGAVVAMAEELDVGPRSLRRALDRFLATVAEGGAEIAGVRRGLVVEKKGR